MPFRRATTTDTLVAVLSSDPDWTALPPRTSRRVRDLLRRLLAKDLRHRLHDIADARIELSTITPDDETEPVAAVRSRWLVAAALIAAALAGAAGAAVWMRWRTPPAESAGVLRFALPLSYPERHASEFLPIVAIAHGGTRIAYVDGAKAQLNLRALDRENASVLPGTEGASGPFFSPDDRWLAFFAGGKLKKIAVEGGTPIVVCDAPNGRGGTWMPDDTIVFAPTNRGGLARVAAAGGNPAPLTTLDPAAKERSHRLPEALPGGTAVVFTVELSGTLFDDARIDVVQVADGSRRTIVEGGYHARPAPGGQLLYARQGAIVAASLDPARWTVTQPAVAAVAGVLQNSVTGMVQFAVSGAGTTAYVPADSIIADAHLVWVDVEGKARAITPAARPYLAPRLSRKGDRLVITVGDGANRDLWTYDFARGAMTRLTFEASLESTGVWSPDDRRIVFSSNRGGARNIYTMPADGSGAIERLTTSTNTQLVGSFTPDGKSLVFEEANPTSGSDIWVLPLEGDKAGAPRALIQTAFSESSPRLSADGRWLAYVSDETGRREVYVRPFPALDGKWQISTEGGIQPNWSRDGGQLFYRLGERMLGVAIETRSGFKARQPRLIFAAPFDLSTQTNYDVGVTGKEFVMIQGGDRSFDQARLVVAVPRLPGANRR
jgi:serine/threonine-protein kinase